MPRSVKSAGKAKKKTDPDDRISIPEAFQRLLRHNAGAGHLTREQLDGALRIGGGAPGGIGLRIGDTIVDPDWYASHMRVAAKVASDGQWNAELEPTGARPIEPGLGAWSVSAKDVTALMVRVGRRRLDEVWFITEAAAYVVANGLPTSPAGSHTAEALYLELNNILGEARCPGRTVAIELLTPFVSRMKEALGIRK
jgi:hypothetical protein